MTTKFFDYKIGTFEFYCRGISHEKQRFGTIFLSAPTARPPQKRKFYFYCRLAVSETWLRIAVSIAFLFRACFKGDLGHYSATIARLRPLSGLERGG